jgi:hypothetical protein
MRNLKIICPIKYPKNNFYIYNLIPFLKYDLKRLYLKIGKIVLENWVIDCIW